ncbi:MAG: secondary thiamine-phosphate synthase enzyme YjbQ [Pseudomonadota bacterium]|nr:secondary thiamine-phosphate synthase enzyme YjbQ [Pseudomonadota bacterium]
MRIVHRHLEVSSGEGITLNDISPPLRDLIEDSGIMNGFVTVTSRHTTTALTINEFEDRLLQDVRNFFGRLVPPDKKYLHNDIHLRDCPPDEPENAHSHLIAMLLGSSEVIALKEGELDLGTWQSVMLVDLDGPRQRTVSVQVYGE